MLSNFLCELPYFPETSLLSLPRFEINELLRDGHSTSKAATDGLLGFFSVTFATSNAKEMARYLENVMDFQEIAFRGLESKSPLIGAHVVRNGNVTFVIVNNIQTPDGEQCNRETRQKLKKSFGNLPKAEEHASLAGQFSSVREKFFKVSLDSFSGSSATELKQLATDAVGAWHVSKFISRHGMGICDISFEVSDVETIFQRAVANGAFPIHPPTIQQDEAGQVKMAVIGVSHSDCTHTLIQKLNYSGAYLPNYKSSNRELSVEHTVTFHEVDHCVQNFSWNEMMKVATFYAASLGLHKFWSVDDNDVSTGNTALRSIVMASGNGKVKLPINEPARAKFRGQIEEFHDYFGGPGVQHVALRTRDIVGTVASMQARGLKFNRISDDYYVNLKERLDKDSLELLEDFERIRQLQILVDFDPSTKFMTTSGNYRCNYLLQIFSEPFHDRPTFFVEIIQRHHHNGFGKGTFKGLFESIELQQTKRGTLVPIE